jgi:hypothetical protein
MRAVFLGKTKDGVKIFIPAGGKISLRRLRSAIRRVLGNKSS